MKAHRKRHARDAPFVEYRAACGRRSACVDIGQSPLTYLLFIVRLSKGDVMAYNTGIPPEKAT